MLVTGALRKCDRASPASPRLCDRLHDAIGNVYPRRAEDGISARYTRLTKITRTRVWPVKSQVDGQEYFDRRKTGPPSGTPPCVAHQFVAPLHGGSGQAVVDFLFTAQHASQRGGPSHTIRRAGAGRLAQRLAQVLYTHKAGGSNPSSPTIDSWRPATHSVRWPFS